jgi:hypothetical protein
MSTDTAGDVDWNEFTARAACASHRLIGWIYRDPTATANHTALGPDAFSDDVATRGAALGDAGNDAAPIAGRVVARTLRGRPRPEDPLLSTWLAVNCIREWRGDTHWALQLADGMSDVATGILDGGARTSADDWSPRSRGADDEALTAAFGELEQRGFATDGVVNVGGLAHRRRLEARLDELCPIAWSGLGADDTRRLLDLVEPVGDRLVERIDQTAGPNRMPAAQLRVAT